jgi:hypothetical protein
MRLKRKTAYAASTGALIAALGGLASLSAQGTATATPATAATAAAAAQRAAVMVHPEIKHVGQVAKQPPTTADCEAAFQVACYEPGQLEQAYNLWPLYNSGVSGQGSTIVIVDSFGSPTIRQDLSFFDQTFNLPGAPSFQVIQPAGAVHFE